MLEGKELEGTFEGGGYSVDVDDKGSVKVEATFAKDFGVGKVSTVNALETNIFKIAEAIAAKTETTWDDKAVATLERLLGIQS